MGTVSLVSVLNSDYLSVFNMLVRYGIGLLSYLTVLLKT